MKKRKTILTLCLLCATSLATTAYVKASWEGWDTEKQDDAWTVLDLTEWTEFASLGTIPSVITTYSATASVTLDEQTARMKAIKRLYDSSAAFQNLKPVYDGLQKIKFEKPRAKYKAEHEAELKQFYAARRKLTGEFPDGKVDMKKLTEEYDELEQAHNTTYGEFKTVRDDLHRLWKVKSCVDTAARFNERTEEQKLQNRPQTRQKKEDMTR